MSEVQQKSIEDRVKKIIREQMAQYGVEVDDIASDANLANEGFDSLDLVEATMGVEDEFGIYIDDGEMRAMLTVQQVIDTVREKIGP
ncbi:acyl carrier protein [Paraburkholderia dilworthii]|uniref:acyl carrier protein n=1 Tax=Paraburkholderia dilworthii TaxID=948106 RepID=UPI0003FCE48F|nr:acyl carrier protein [Paraburkholderia dilworthii]